MNGDILIMSMFDSQVKREEFFLTTHIFGLQG